MLNTTETALAGLTPEVAIQRAKAAYQIVKEMREAVLIQNVDFGVISGTSKPTLYKPGAEKLCRAFGYNPVFETVNKVEQWDDDAPLFHYEIRCRLVRIEDGKEIATGIGSCNSKENKYRWRWMFDNQLKEAGIESTGLMTKKGTGKNGRAYTQYRVPNDDVFSIVNTIEKMACKRALIAAVLVGVGASEFFTQDVEDLRDFAGDVVEGEFEVITEAPPAAPQSAPSVAPVVSSPTIQKPAETPGKPVKWERNDAELFFKHWTQVKALTQTQVLEALGVKHLMDFVGGRGAAEDRVNKWLNSQIPQGK